jgi:hypothetical protein
MSEHNTCLNCGAAVTTNYCGHCGQKSATHRFTIGHLIAHDVIHGVFHLDKGFLFTVKQLFTRPGNAIREYIEGKRVNHFNSVTFLLLVLAVNVFLISTGWFSFAKVIGVPQNQNILENIQHFLSKNYKALLAFTIPANALITFLVFSKAKLNYAEHLVMQTYREGGNLFIQTIFMSIIGFCDNSTIQRGLFGLMGTATGIYGIWYFWQFFSRDFKNKFAQAGLLLLMLTVNALIAGSIAYFFLLKPFM